MFSLTISRTIPETVFYSLKDYPSHPKNPFDRKIDKLGEEESIPTTCKVCKLDLIRGF